MKKGVGFMAEKDYSKYFRPNLKNARRRGQEESRVLHEEFVIPESMKNAGAGKTYYIKTYGCQANERDGETMAGILEQMKYQPTEDMYSADVVLLNTCAVRENAELKVFGKIGDLKRIKQQRPDMIFGVCGCMAQEEAIVNRILEKHHQTDLIFGTHNVHRLPQLLEEAMYSKAQVVEVWSKEGDVIENIPSNRASNLKAWVNIMYGCDHFCTYCIVPYTRGKERSRLPEDIKAEVQDLIDQGYKEITLLGQNVNSYGLDLDNGYDFAKLLNEVAQMDVKRIRFTTSNPWDFKEEVFEMIAKYDNLMPYIHLPLQSGNNDVLRRMARRNTAESYIELVDKIRKHIPNCAISTDIIVGFPNETREQFEDTLKMVDYVHYDNAYTFIYSPREGTPAAKMEDTIPFEEKQRRLQELNEHVNKWDLINNKKYEGKIVPVLIEGYSKKNKDLLMGYTDTQKLVNVKGDPKYIGEIVDVLITEAKTWSLDGEIHE